jgi:hypothetical protein
VTRWSVYVSPDEAHVIPSEDVIEHDRNDDCICGPQNEPVRRDDGSFGWLTTHRLVKTAVEQP